MPSESYGEDAGVPSVSVGEIGEASSGSDVENGVVSFVVPACS